MSPDVDSKQLSTLKTIIQNHRGKIVTSPQKATHVIESRQEGDPDEDPDLEYLRTIDHRERMNLVHWWYYPDSYDTWLPATDVQGEQPDPDPPHLGVWRVSTRFIKDLDQFNEWMNELDYEIEEEEQTAEGGPKPRRRKGNRSNKRKPDVEVEGEDLESKSGKKSPSAGRKTKDTGEGIKVRISRDIMVSTRRNAI